MPSITFDESEIVIKQTVTTVYDNGNCYLGRAVTDMIKTGKFKATLIITEVVES